MGVDDNKGDDNNKWDDNDKGEGGNKGVFVGLASRRSAWAGVPGELSSPVCRVKLADCRGSG